jgi:hypothetical protein
MKSDLCGWRRKRGPLFTSLHHDNNHPLNTVYLYVVGTQPNWRVDLGGVPARRPSTVDTIGFARYEA